MATIRPCRLCGKALVTGYGKQYCPACADIRSTEAKHANLAERKYRHEHPEEYADWISKQKELQARKMEARQRIAVYKNIIITKDISELDPDCKPQYCGIYLARREANIGGGYNYILEDFGKDKKQILIRGDECAEVAAG